MARDIQLIFGYTEWRNFESVIEKARIACDGAGVQSSHHFVETNKVIKAGKGAQLERADCYLTRYACYLVAMNGDSTKPEIATAQTYFAVQTRRQEVSDQEKRLALRERVRISNKVLAGTAREAVPGLLSFLATPITQRHGYPSDAGEATAKNESNKGGEKGSGEA